jgi:hypothetical protein
MTSTTHLPPCTCTDSLWSHGTQECPSHGPDNQRHAQEEAAAELDADQAYVRHLENEGWAEAQAFEAWEAERITPAEYDRTYGGGRYA